MLASWAERLIQLQKIDMEVRAMRQRLKLIPEEITRLTGEMKAAAARAEKVKEAVRKHELALRQTESEIAAAESKIQKLKQQSALVKKNTEYQAMLAEAELCKKLISELEERSIQEMDAIEAGKKEYKSVARESNSVIENCRTEIFELRDVAKEFAAEIEKKLADRKVIRPMINGELLSRYDVIEKKGDGLPAAEVKEDCVCGNCRLKVTPQALTDMRAGKVVFCDNCMHIIYTRLPDND